MNAEEKAERERLEATLTSKQLEEYDRLKAEIKRSLTDSMVAPLKKLVGGVVNEEFAEGFEEGFRDAMAIGDAKNEFEEAMEEELDRE